jgi:c-di-GMP-binding flagellar brake protein YcgR
LEERYMQAEAAAENWAERRRHHRKELLTKVEYSCEGGRYFGRTVDVSKSGMCLETFFAHRVGQQVALLFRIFEGKDPVIVRGEIMWVKEIGRSAGPTQVLRKRRMGIKFSGIEEAMAKTLHYYLVEEALFR